MILAILEVVYTAEETNGECLLKNSQGDSVSSDSVRELLAFLARNYGDETTINKKAVYDLHDFISPILRRLGQEVSRRLLQEPECQAYFTFNGDDIEIHDLSEIPKPIRDYRGKDKIELPEGYFSIKYYRHSSPAFCIQHGVSYTSYFYHLKQYANDVGEVNTLDENMEVLKRINETLFRIGFQRRLSLYSPISLFEENVLKFMDVPNISEIRLEESIKDKLIRWSEELITRNDWRVNFAIGHWAEGESFDYDISSCYAYELSNLVSVSEADFIHTKTKPDKASDGIMYGQLTINPDVRVSPIPYQRIFGDGSKLESRTIYPTGSTWCDLITLNQVRFLYKWGIGTFKLEDGIFWSYRNTTKAPFEAILKRYFDKRSLGKDADKMCKKISAACWGKFIQRHTAPGHNPYYNPLMAMQVKVGAVLKVADFIYSNGLQNHVLYIATDGVRTDKEVPGILSESRFGQWRFTGSSPVVILQPSREVTDKNKSTGMYYSEFIDMVNEKPDETFYTHKYQRRVTLGEAVEREDLSQVGIMDDFSDRIDILSLRSKRHQKCVFEDYPQTGHDLITGKYYGSSPQIEKI